MYKPKITKDDFSAWFMEHPGASIDEICDTFDVSISCAYQKRKQYFSEHRYDPNSVKIGAKIYQEGLDHGLLIGSGLGALIGDLAKSKGMSVGDLLEKIANWLNPKPPEPGSA
jgi:hypothetical protein